MVGLLFLRFVQLNRLIVMNNIKQTKDDFIAGFICAGGDVEEAKDQAEQFVICCGYGEKMYKYEEMKEQLFTDNGQKLLFEILDNVNRILGQYSIVMMQDAIKGCSGDSWLMLACVDRLVELGELIEVSRDGCAGQHRVFMRKN